MENTNSFKFSMPILKTYIDKSTNKRIIEGLASGTELDLSGERMSTNAIKTMAESLKELLKNSGTLNIEHLQGWAYEIGDIIDLRIDEKNNLIMKAALDESPMADTLWYRLTKQGKKIGLSIEGIVNDFSTIFDDTLGYYTRVYEDIKLTAIAVTSSPAYPLSYLSSIAKSINGIKLGFNKKLSMNAEQTNVVKSENEEEKIVEESTGKTSEVSEKTTEENLSEEKNSTEEIKTENKSEDGVEVESTKVESVETKVEEDKTGEISTQEKIDEDKKESEVSNNEETKDKPVETNTNEETLEINTAEKSAEKQEEQSTEDTKVENVEKEKQEIVNEVSEEAKNEETNTDESEENTSNESEETSVKKSINKDFATKQDLEELKTLIIGIKDTIAKSTEVKIEEEKTEENSEEIKKTEETTVEKLTEVVKSLENKVVTLQSQVSKSTTNRRTVDLNKFEDETKVEKSMEEELKEKELELRKSHKFNTHWFTEASKIRRKYGMIK